jgi:hypothetical protein
MNSTIKALGIGITTLVLGGLLLGVVFPSPSTKHHVCVFIL